jgi:hypothetical protein
LIPKGRKMHKKASLQKGLQVHPEKRVRAKPGRRPGIRISKVWEFLRSYLYTKSNCNIQMTDV